MFHSPVACVCSGVGVSLLSCPFTIKVSVNSDGALDSVIRLYYNICLRFSGNSILTTLQITLGRRGDDITMATGGSGQLTGSQIARLAAAISVQSMKTLAVSYFEITEETVKNIVFDNLGDSEAANREIINQWRNKNPGDQVQV